MLSHCIVCPLAFQQGPNRFEQMLTLCFFVSFLSLGSQIEGVLYQLLRQNLQEEADNLPPTIS
mgnify:CR=1 FL=1